MTSSSPTPKLPIWVFFATDVVLLAAAVFIAQHSARPLSETATLGIVGCILAGAIVALVPLIVYYERQKNETLDDRQRALEALARTVASSAEQISIAAGGLNEIADVAQKNVRHAEQLPHKMQEKIAEFQAQLANVNETEREELEKELEDLRASESERLQSTFDKISKTAAEFAKLEAATQQHLTAANEAVAKLSFGTAAAIGKAQAAAEQALSQARQEAARTVGDATGTALKSIESAKATAIADLATRIDGDIARLTAATVELGTMIEKLQAVAAKPMVALAPAVPEIDATSPAAITSATPPPVAEDASLAPEPTATPPKKPRKQRREEAPVHEPAPVPIPVEPAPSNEAVPDAPPISEAPVAAPVEETPASPEPAPAEATAVEASPEAPAAAAPAPVEPAPVSTEPISEITPVVPVTAEPFPPTTPPAAEPAAPAETAEAPKPPRKPRPPKKIEDEQPSLGLDIEETKPNGDDAVPQGIVERVLTSDGATRLLVTAYIGIGNRLFIRGSGPGLSWDRGVPLQFVSIGKWRWETNDASGPVQFKLLKNDDQECSGLGMLTIDPGHQHEVTASFN